MTSDQISFQFASGGARLLPSQVSTRSEDAAQQIKRRRATGGIGSKQGRKRVDRALLIEPHQPVLLPQDFFEAHERHPFGGLDAMREFAWSNGEALLIDAAFRQAKMQGEGTAARLPPAAADIETMFQLGAQPGCALRFSDEVAFDALGSRAWSCWGQR